MKYGRDLNESSNRIRVSFFDLLIVQRMMAFIIDLFSCDCACIMVIYILNQVIKKDIYTATIVIIIIMFSFVCLFCRDLLKPSIGKRIMHLSIVQNDSSSIIPFWKLVARNLTLVIWPIEFIVLNNTNGTQRIADKWLNLSIIKK